MFNLIPYYYGAFVVKSGLYASPEVQSVKRVEGGIVITFDNVGDGISLQGKAGFYALNSLGTAQRLLPEVLTDNSLYLPLAGNEPIELEYGMRFENEQGEKPQTMAQAVSVYNTKNGKLAYPLDSFRISL